MNEPDSNDFSADDQPCLVTDLLILSDGTVLAHNLTPVMATLLSRINLQDERVEHDPGRAGSEQNVP